jgi:hypothetical protein
MEMRHHTHYVKGIKMKRKAYLFVIAIKGSASSYSLPVQGLHASERRKKIHVNFPYIQKYFLSLFVV